ncbi:putative non-specific serine/threonine protein kinase [Dioscorea sansibarensis]
MALRKPFLSLFILLLPLYLTISIFSASDHISINQSLSGDQELISNGGSFALGFFLITNSSSSFYVGIWYNKISVFTPVWMANRATPVSDPTRSVLQISQDGNLVLFNEVSSLI